MHPIRLAWLPCLLALACGGGGGGASDPGAPDAVADLPADPGPDATPPRPTTPFPWSAEATDEACANGQDDDHNGFTDCDDFACSRNLAVTVCGSKAAYEGSPAFCTDGADDDGDGLIDCDDPDCAKTPFHDACPKPGSERDCTGAGDTDGDGLAACDDADCLAAGAPCPKPAGKVRVLFDLTLDETAGAGPNSDWMVDAAGRLPVPSNPDGPERWAGALSSFGYALFASGDFLIEQLPSWEGRLTYGDATNVQDLAAYDVLVLWEPSRKATAAEKQAVVRFVLDGGSLLAVSNHFGADRDGNGWSAPKAFDDLIDDNGVQADPFGFRFDLDDIGVKEGSLFLARLGDASHPVLAGPAGAVKRVGYYSGCTATLTGTAPASGLVLLDSAPDAAHHVVTGAAEPGKGRVVFHGDSAVGTDGTDSHGNRNPSHDAWDDASIDNRALLLNAMRWLGRL